jgi:hypothetical protein
MAVPLPNVLCRNTNDVGSSIVSEYWGELGKCGSSHIGVEMKGVEQPICATTPSFMTDAGKAAFDAKDGFVKLSWSLYLNVRKTEYYSFDFHIVEGMFHSAAFTVEGLVRVRYQPFFEEDFEIYLEPVDPADFGLTWKYHNTLDAYRNRASGIKIVDLSEKIEPRAQVVLPSGADLPSLPLVSFWNHNGSTMQMIEDGPRRVLIYHKPREGLEKSGIRPSTVLFEGISVDGANYSGQSFTFLKACGSTPYSVTGTTGRGQVILTGKAPKFDAECRQVGSRDVTMVFEAE